MMTERKPLIEMESEEALLSNVIMGRISEHAENFLALPNVQERFGDPKHKLVVGALLRIQDRNEKVWVKGIAEELGEKLAGGLDYLRDLASESVTTAFDKWHVNQINEAFKRRLLHGHVDIVTGLVDTGGDDEDLLEMAEKSLESARKSAELGEESMMDGRQAALIAMADLEATMQGDRLPGISSGWERFDEATQGLPPSELTVIGGRTSMGKTAFSISLLANLIRLGTPTVFFSLEMPRRQLMNRLASIMSGVDLSKIIAGALNPQERIDVKDALGKIAAAPFFIDDTPGVTSQFIRAKVRRLVKSGVQVVMVDYIQIVKPSRIFKTRQEAVAEISSALTRIAKEFRVSMVALAQLNREGDSKPELKNFRECGDIEQDASLALLIHRPNIIKYDGPILEDSEPEECYLLLAKNRNGRTGPMGMTFEGKITKFEVR